MKPAPFTYVRPDTLAEALGLLKEEPEARVMAGGQSLGPLLNLRLAQPRHVIDISRLDELCGSSVAGDTLAIGACVTHAQIEDGKIPDIAPRGFLPHVAKGIAYRAVRNRGTLGGSLAHADPAADWLTAMIALDASLELRGANGKSQIKVAKFVTGALQTSIEAGHLVSCVLLPRLSASARWGYAKYARKPGDFAESMAVAMVDPERGFSSRIVLGRRSEPPALMPASSQLLTASQANPSAEKLEAATEADLRSAKVEAGDWTMHRAIVLRAIRALA
ncbi:MAG TPA: FAD binding domain-containing protein [Xanthobacteraceae bacterium]|jgi:carbon-monoxide dehydrogenase medium subunit